MAEMVSSKVNRCSYPSELKITDIRFTDIVGAPMHCTLMKIYTNQGIVGLSEVRDGGNRVFAEMLKSRLLGENPCNVEKLFRRVKQFGGLLKHILPVRIDPEGAVLRIADHHYKMADGQYASACSGAALMSGIPIHKRFSGTGYDPAMRVQGDFGSNLFTITREK